MKRHVYFLVFMFAVLPLLAGCGKKPAWIPLWTAPPPGSTAGASGEPADGDVAATSQADADALFATDADKMDNPRIAVYKSRHVLEVYDGDTLMARMKVAVGRAEGAKKRSGDNKTPEGDYYICSTSDTGKSYKSLFLSYPNSDDSYAGLNDKVLTQAQYDDIVSSIDRRLQPAWDTGLGGEIAVSGTGAAGKGRVGDWTAGNVSVSDKDMDYLWKYITVGVDVEINP